MLNVFFYVEYKITLWLLHKISFPSNDNSNSKSTVARYIEPLYMCASVFNVSMVKTKLLGNKEDQN
jgi:hypothetical protein